MSDFRFAHPDWSLAIWLVLAVLLLLFWLDLQRRDVLSRFLSVAMQRRLVHRLSPTRRWLSLCFLGMTCFCLLLALMRPQWGLSYERTPRVGAQVMVCLDVSRSMLAEDTAPNRLERAKAELTDLLSYLEGDQVGLIAFAGRAVVKCPLTPDFGFFRLVLQEAGPHSVGRGGTRLEEPIRKALDGFRTEADVSRLLVLITDGEDHDSHPLDAAQDAAERGVKILAVGFGDEAGSELYVTDPQTNARVPIRDAEGQTVVTRLDGQTLREMALATDGAYIPAGTGALDLKSIYEAHIAPLVRGKLDDRGQPIRQEIFQWPLLAGFLFLSTSVLLGSSSMKSELLAGAQVAHLAKTHKTFSGAQTAAAMLLAGWLATQLTTQLAGQPAQAQQDQPTAPADGQRELPSETANRQRTEEPELADPQEIYNQALAFLETDLDRAEQMLTQARRKAGTNGQVRFRATYNLGWVEVKRADEVIEEKPQMALDFLRRAADRFRDAVRLRPENNDSRHNLEVVLRRILELKDSLSQQDQGNLAEQLDALIEEQRSLVSEARELVARVALEDTAATLDQFRSEFRRLSVRQRKTLAQCQSTTNSAREEADTLSGKSDQEQTPQQRIRFAQLTNVLHYLNRANQRLGQARGQMRRRQAQRSFRRSAMGLTELKRARDQLRSPVEVLDVILADALSLAELTAAKSQAAGILSELPAGSNGQGDVAVGSSRSTKQLSWLTQDYLEDRLQPLTERTAELAMRLQAALEQQEASASEVTSPGGGQQAESDQLLEAIQEALPYLFAGKKSLESASVSLAVDRFDEAATKEQEAIASLRKAREQFLDLRRLIELTYLTEDQIEQLLQTSSELEQGGPADQQRLRVALAAEQQQDNLPRGQRLAQLIETELSRLPPPADEPQESASSPPDPAQQQAAAERQRLELAKGLLALARQEMAAAAEELQPPRPPELPDQAGTPGQREFLSPWQRPMSLVPGAEASPLPHPARAHVGQAVQHLKALRRLFFSIAEHLRETAQRQANLNDETEQVITLAEAEGDEVAQRSGPLAARQRELQLIAEQIGQVLQEQSQQQPPTPPAPGAGQQASDPQLLAQLQQMAQRLGQAAQLVQEGSVEMEQVVQELSASQNQSSQQDQQALRPEPSDPQASSNDARGHQDAALAKLVEALALLQPPQQPNQQQDQSEPSQSQQDRQEDQKQAGSGQRNEDQPTAGFDPSRLLQAVRDREAQRRRDRERRGRLDQEPVLKDW